jgi:hypothetical protein
MPFVKLDCGMLNSTLWFEREAREVFITALLMAEPREYLVHLPQLKVDSLQETGWQVPPGWYGFVPAAGKGIIHRARVDPVAGMDALVLLGSPEETSRSQDFDGRRLVRIDGGYLVLNYMKYRERDYTSAERSRRYRERVASRRSATPTHRDITQAEAEAEAEILELVPVDRISTAEPAPSALDASFDAFWRLYPKKTGKGAALKAWKKIKPANGLCERIAATLALYCQSDQWQKDHGQFIPNPATWLNQGRWDDEPVSSSAHSNGVGNTTGHEPVDWYEECGILHKHECQLDRYKHALRLRSDALKAEVG